jgi:hypothetical protein
MQGESKEEMLYLYSLQQSNKHILSTDMQLPALDAAYLCIWPKLLKVIVAVAGHHKVCDDAVYLAASLLDAYRAKSLPRQSVDEHPVSVANMHIFALAGFVFAASYMEGRAVVYKFCVADSTMKQLQCRAENVPLSHYTSSWMQQSETLMPGEDYILTADDLKQAQILMANVLDWRFNRATADRFLNVFITQHFMNAQLCSTTSTTSTTCMQASMQEYIPWTRYFCESAVMSNLSCHYEQSAVAAAAIFAARSLLYEDSALPIDLQDVYGITDPLQLRKCVDEMLDSHKRRWNSHMSVASHSEGDVVAEADFEAVELRCTEEMFPAGFSATLSPAALSLADVIVSTPQTAVKPASLLRHKCKKRQDTREDSSFVCDSPPHYGNFVWDSPPLWISPSPSHAQRAFLAFAAAD